MALGDLVGISTSQGVRAYDNGDGTFTLQVQTTAGVPTTTVITKYTVSTAFAVPAPGGAIGDVVQSLQTFNTTTGALLSTVWTNVTTGAVYASAPPLVDLTPVAPNDPYGTQFFEYIAKTASAGVSVGDVVQRAVSTDLATAIPINTWYNITTGLFLATPPAAANLTPVIPYPSYLSASFTYTVTVPFAGALLGDVLVRYDVLDPTTTPPTLVSETWYNVTQGTTLGATPSYADILPSNGSFTPVLPQKTADVALATGPGTTAAGAIQVSFVNVGAGNAIVGVSGNSILPGTALDFTAASGGSIDSVPYDATGTTLLIATIV